MKALDEMLVLIPGSLGVQVVPLGDLLTALEDEELDWDGALDKASIEYLVMERQLPEAISRVRSSNASATFTYWETS
jgi:hypothetical protein